MVIFMVTFRAENKGEKMATIMEKDVLLEYASIGYLTAGKTVTAGMKEDLTAIGKLREDILMNSPEDIDYEFMLNKFKEIRLKYE